MLVSNPLTASDVYLSKHMSNNNIIIGFPCVMADGGWTIIQRRVDGTLDFDRTWQEYANGFGVPNGEFWLGLEAIHQLTSAGAAVRLKIDLEAFDGDDVGPFTVYYDQFIVDDADSIYQLSIG